MNQHLTIWMTGYSGAGKTTLSKALIDKMKNQKVTIFHLDGDDVRNGLNSDLKFSSDDRRENIRRLTEVALLFHRSIADDTKTLVVVSAISPFSKDRCKARVRHEENYITFAEVFCDASLSITRQRDVKGLYKMKLPDFTGISSPYEIPLEPNLHLHTDQESIDSCVTKLHTLVTTVLFSEISNT